MTNGGSSNTPLVIGGSLSVRDSTELSELDPFGLPLGTLVFNQELLEEFELVLSDADTIPDQIVSVKGTNGVRWVRHNGGSGDYGVPPNNTWASPAGDENNDGLTPETAKKYATSAILVADGLGGGTVNIANNTLANPVTGRGINLSGPFDVGTFPANKGWIRVGTALHLNFIPAANEAFAWGQGRILPEGGTWLGPMLQVAGLDDTTYTNGSFNFFEPFSAALIGFSSELASWAIGTTYAFNASVMYAGHSYSSKTNGNVGNQPDTSPADWARVSPEADIPLGASLTAQHRFENCVFGADGAPGLDFGYLFWAWFDQCVGLQFNATIDGDPKLTCSIRYLSSTVATQYLHYWTNCRVAGGGFYVKGSQALFSAQTMFGESMFTPLFLLEPGVVANGGGSPNGTFVDIQSTDSAVNIAVQNNGTTLITVRDSGKVIGPAIQYTSSFFPSDKLYEQAMGITGAVCKMQQDSARRGLGPVTTSLPNIALTTALQSAATPVAGIDGRIAGAITGSVYNYLDGTYAIPHVGDMYAWGGWIQANGTVPSFGVCDVSNNVSGTDFVFQMIGAGAAPGTNVTLAPGASIGWASTDGQPVQRGQWVWAWAAIKIVSTDGSSGFQVQADISANSIDRPWMVHAPAGSMSVSEFLEQALASVDTPNAGGTLFSGVPPLAPAVGMPALWPGQKLAFWDATLGAWKYLDIDNGAVRVT